MTVTSADLSEGSMADSMLRLQGTGYVPGVAHGTLQRGTGRPGSIALIGPSDVVGPLGDPAGLIVVDGAPLSHRMIGLVARGLPTVLISTAQATRLLPGSPLWLDGATGLITDGEPGPAERSPPPPPESGRAVRLADGTKVRLMASVRGTAGVQKAVGCGAASIGLVRSEFLGADRSRPPDRAYFRQAFQELDEAAGRLKLTIRLIDLAADKPPSWLTDATELLRPLGMQGVRLYRLDPVRRVLDAQLGALAEWAERRPVEVLIPFLGSLQELTHWTRLVRDALPDSTPVGAMLETPAAVLDIRNWSAITDFVAIGCNDLMQCLFGADRDEPRVRDCLDPYAPVLYRLLNDVAAAAPRRVESVRLCGVLPRLAGVLPLLVGVGLRQFSVDPVWIPYLARDLAVGTLPDAEALAGRVMACRHSDEVRAMLGLPQRPAGTV